MSEEVNLHYLTVFRYEMSASWTILLADDNSFRDLIPPALAIVAMVALLLRPIGYPLAFHVLGVLDSILA
jgi:uncharacterized membrane protein